MKNAKQKTLAEMGENEKPKKTQEKKTIRNQVCEEVCEERTREQMLHKCNKRMGMKEKGKGASPSPFFSS